MPFSIGTLTLILAAVAALFSILSLVRSGSRRCVPEERLIKLLRDECGSINQVAENDARRLREELANSMRAHQESATHILNQFNTLAVNQMKGASDQLEKGLKASEERSTHSESRLLRDLNDNFGRLSEGVSARIEELQQIQKDGFGDLARELSSLSENQERRQESLRQIVENRLDTLRNENTVKLDEMRRTVDERLQSTLENRLDESFRTVVEQLERVHQGLGEMHSLAAGVGDLKKVLSNVRIRGAFGECQVAMILEQCLSPEQFIRNAQIKTDSQERVEFAIRLPGRDSGAEVLLPVDAKFPHEDYHRLISAAESGNTAAVAEAAKSLENQVRQFAKGISEKYICPPRTTDFAVLFLATEGLYAEVLRRPGFFEQLQREYHVVLTGPTTFAALLNALQIGFRSLAIEKRSSEVWQLLGAVSSEFTAYNKIVDTVSRQLGTASRSVDKLSARAKIVNRKLRDVEKPPVETAKVLIGDSIEDEPEVSDETEADNEAAEIPSF